VCACIRTRIRTRIHTCTRIRTHTRARTLTHSQAHAHTHTHTLTHTRAHTHTLPFSLFLSLSLSFSHTRWIARVLFPAFLSRTLSLARSLPLSYAHIEIEISRQPVASVAYEGVMSHVEKSCDSWRSHGHMNVSYNIYRSHVTHERDTG